MNTVAKGRRNEIRAEKFMLKEGYIVHRVRRSRYGPQDFFGLFDLICLSKHKPTVWVQVKTNRLPTMKPFSEFQDQYLGYDNQIWLMAWMEKSNAWKIKVV